MLWKDELPLPTTPTMKETYNLVPSSVSNKHLSHSLLSAMIAGPDLDIVFYLHDSNDSFIATSLTRYTLLSLTHSCMNYEF